MSRTRLAEVTSLAVLGRWLGPWSNERRAPGGVERRELHIDGPRPFVAWEYRPRRPQGACLLLHGLHYAGPADPRLDRFARILAASGLVVLAPFLPDLCALMLRPSLHDDAGRALDRLLEIAPGAPPAVFSISFGCLALARLAAERAGVLSQAVVFGGYADVDAALRFCVRGDGARPHDPLNAPVVFMNLLDAIPEAEAHAGALRAACRTFVTSTWGQPELKAKESWQPIARAIAAELPAPARELGRVLLGVEPGRVELLERALAQPAAARAWLDPRPDAARAAVPVAVVHGADDDVIPFEQAAALEAALPPARRAGRWITGLYSHSARGPGAGRNLPRLASELVTLLGVLRLFARLGRMPDAAQP